MREIEFSVMINEETTSDGPQRLSPLLQAFEMQHNIHVKLVPIPWNHGWTEVVKFGLFGHGPDVSEVGTTWIGSLASMQAVRPFTPKEIRSLGGDEVFFQTNWQTGFLPGDERPWAIPWLGDAILVYYWKDALEKAGITDPQAAFASHEALIETLRKLRDHGFPHPLSITVENANRVLHEASSWIWNAGGSLMSPDARQVTFAEEQAVKGLHDYFSLLPFFNPQAPAATVLDAPSETDKAVVFLAGPWHGTIGRHENPEWSERLGIANLFETAYVGGSSFVTWNHSSRSQESFELIRFLSSQPAHIPGSPHAVMLPVRRDALHMPSVEEDVFQRTCLRALEAGKTFPTVKLWGSVEDKLDQSLAAIWAKLFANPNENLEACIHEQIDPLAKRLNLTLSS